MLRCYKDTERKLPVDVSSFVNVINERLSVGNTYGPLPGPAQNKYILLAPFKSDYLQCQWDRKQATFTHTSTMLLGASMHINAQRWPIKHLKRLRPLAGVLTSFHWWSFPTCWRSHALSAKLYLFHPLNSSHNSRQAFWKRQGKHQRRFFFSFFFLHLPSVYNVEL